MAIGAVIMLWLTPDQYGLWQSVNLIAIYGYVLLAGINPGLARELPFALGAKKNKLAKNLASTTKMISIVIALLLVVISFISSLFISDQQIKIGIIIISIVTGIGFYRNYLLETCRANGELLVLLKVQGFEILLMIGSLFAVYKFQYYGMLYRALVIMILVTIMLSFLDPMKDILPKWNKKAFITLLKTGFPIYMSSYLLLIGTTTDRLILAKQYEPEILGFYSPALMIFTAFQLIPNAISQYLSPKMSFQFGKSNSVEEIWTICWKSSIILLLIALPVSIIGWILIPIIINNFYPDYVNGIQAAKIACISGTIASSATGWMAMQSIKAFKTMFVIGIFIIVIGFAVPLVLSTIFSPLLAVSYGKLVTFFLYVLLSLIAVKFISVKKIHSV